MWKRLDRYTRAYSFKVSQMGLAGATRYAAARVLDWLLGRERGRITLDHTRDVFKAYDMVLSGPIEPTPGARVPRSMNWIIPGFSIGSGGHLNIFRMVAMLEAQGYVCRIFISDLTVFNSAEQARDLINAHFVKLAADVDIGVTAMPPCDYIVATGWDTAYWARAFTGARHYLYFVQDFEPYFFARGSDYAFAEQTYRLGFTGLTAGQWLAGKLRRDFGMPTRAFSFSFDKERYRPLPRRPGPRRIFFYARHVTVRRGFELGLLALELLSQRLPDVEFLLAGWDSSGFRIPFPYLNAGVVALDDLPDMYSQCDVALVLSFTNLSLLPLELMACGCPVVSNRGPNVEWLLTDGVDARLSDPTPAALAQALFDVLEDAGLRQRLVQGGLARAAASDWEEEGRKVAAFLAELDGSAARAEPLSQVVG